MTQFRSPRRRSVRQRSGFGVAEETTGGEVKINRAARLDIGKNENEFRFTHPDEEIPELFESDNGLVAFGGYLYSPVPLDIEINVTAETKDSTHSEDDTYEIEPNEWGAVGVHVEVPLTSINEPFGDISATLHIQSDDTIPWIDVFGINLSSIEYEDYLNNLYYDGREETIEVAFHQQTWRSIPYLYYLDHEAPFLSAPIGVNPAELPEGTYIVLKSCNRCARLLPIEHQKEKERHKVSFANHCGSRAPCNHSSFGRLRVVEDKSLLTGLPQSLESVIERSGDSIELNLHHGYQLECKACKKFYVNFPLNPKRSSTQHREDQIRRRTIDALLHELLDKDSVYHNYRFNHDKEFDRHIWEKFGKMCFNCEREINSPSEMELDHTRPLAALWPLDEHATCLCGPCNRDKSDRFPMEFYSERKLSKLADITGLPERELRTKRVNPDAIEELRERIVWFFDEYLARDELQKDRDGKIVADIIVQSIQSRLKDSEAALDLVDEYRSQTGETPNTITVG